MSCYNRLNRLASELDLNRTGLGALSVSHVRTPHNNVGWSA